MTVAFAGMRQCDQGKRRAGREEEPPVSGWKGGVGKLNRNATRSPLRWRRRESGPIPVEIQPSRTICTFRHRSDVRERLRRAGWNLSHVFAPRTSRPARAAKDGPLFHTHSRTISRLRMALSDRSGKRLGPSWRRGGPRKSRANTWKRFPACPS